MKLQEPRLPDRPLPTEDFLSLAERHREEERPIEGILLGDHRLEQADFSKLELRQSIIEGCTFLECSFEGASFSDLFFSGCNFSNCRFSNAYFSRCRFVGCKCVGVDLNGAILKQCTVQSSNLRYAILDKAKLTGLVLAEVDFTEASLAEVKWKEIEIQGCRFVRTGFFKTPLAGLDFTQSELLSPLLSSPPTELRGAKVSLWQAADLLGLFGVIVER